MAMAAASFTGGEAEEPRLLLVQEVQLGAGLLRHASLLDVAHDADDGERGRLPGTGEDVDALADRLELAEGEEGLLERFVHQQSGRALGHFESMSRNLIRFIDMLPVFYFVGAICVFVNRRQQRLGDMAAGTLVVHSTPVDTPFIPAGGRTFTAASFERPVEEAPTFLSSGLQLDAVSRLGHEDLQMIDNFLARRLDLPLDVRAKLAQKLAQRMASKMLQEPPAMSDETFLESLAIALRQGGAG